MNILETIAQKWNACMDTVRPYVKKVWAFFREFGKAIDVVWTYIVKLRKVIMAVPVAWGAIYLAMRNLIELPKTVGLDLQSDGTFTVMIAREAAALGPVAITAVCLLLMFWSKRTLTPWLVSIFSLVLPLLILVTNTFPA